MEYVKVKDITRPFNEEFDMYRRIIYAYGQYQINCLISFPDSSVEYTVQVPGSIIKVDAYVHEKEPAVFSLNNASLLTAINKEELINFMKELEDVLEIYKAVEELDIKYNTLRNIDGKWTKEKVKEVCPYV